MPAEKGTTDFCPASTRIVLIVFDLLFLNGEDSGNCP